MGKSPLEELAEGCEVLARLVRDFDAAAPTSPTFCGYTAEQVLEMARLTPTLPALRQQASKSERRRQALLEAVKPLSEKVASLRHTIRRRGSLIAKLKAENARLTSELAGRNREIGVLLRKLAEAEG